MKRVFSFVLILMLFLVVLSSANADIDITKMSKDELLDLQVQINARLKEINGDSKIIYDGKEAKIQWVDVIVNQFGYVQNSMIITNKTNEPLYYSFDNVAFNGFQVAMTNAAISFESITPNMSFLTSSAFEYLFEKSNLEMVGINDISNINDVYFEISFYKENTYSAKPFNTEKIRISLPLQ